MKDLTDERWQEIRDYANHDQPLADGLGLTEVLQQYDHLAAQIKLLADYIMNERPDDPAWQHNGACAMAIEIMKREGNSRMEQKIDALAEKFDRMISEANQTKVDLQMTRNMIETAEKENLAFPPFKIGK